MAPACFFHLIQSDRTDQSGHRGSELYPLDVCKYLLAGHILRENVLEFWGYGTLVSLQRAPHSAWSCLPSWDCSNRKAQRHLAVFFKKHAASSLSSRPWLLLWSPVMVPAEKALFLYAVSLLCFGSASSFISARQEDGAVFWIWMLSLHCIPPRLVVSTLLSLVKKVSRTRRFRCSDPVLEMHEDNIFMMCHTFTHINTYLPCTIGTVAAWNPRPHQGRGHAAMWQRRAFPLEAGKQQYCSRAVSHSGTPEC